MEKSEIVVIIIGGAVIVMLLIIFILIFFVIHQRRQQSHLLEKTALKAAFDQEIREAEGEIQEATLRHVGRELHDNVGQILTLVKIQLGKLIEENPGNQRLHDSKDFLHKALQDLRALTKGLNSEAILQEGLVKAIQFELERVRKVGVLQVEFDSTVQTYTLDRNKEVLVFRIFQELLQNVLKHAQARHLYVHLLIKSDGLTLDFSDDGIGFSLTEKQEKKGFEAGSGIPNLIHRAKLMQGTLQFQTPEKGGTRALLFIPFTFST